MGYSRPADVARVGSRGWWRGLDVSRDTATSQANGCSHAVEPPGFVVQVDVDSTVRHRVVGRRHPEQQGPSHRRDGHAGLLQQRWWSVVPAQSVGNDDSSGVLRGRQYGEMSMTAGGKVR